MSYRRVRSYRRRDARRYRDVPERPRARRVPMIGLLTVALVAGIATLSAPHIKAMLTVASSTEGLAGNCAAPAAAGLAGPARSDAAAGVPMAVADSRVLSAPATPVPTSEGGSAAAAPTATASVVPTSTAPGMTSTSASTPSATNSSGTPAPAASAKSSSAAPAPTASAGTTPCPSATAATPPAANTNCEIVVPAHPLTAAGLATPYRLTGPGGATPAASGCTMANEANLGAFVQATILDQATGKLWVYEPLVITKGTKPAVTPVMPSTSGARGRHDRRWLQRRQPDAGGRHFARFASGSLPQRPREFDIRSGVVLPRHALLLGRAQSRKARQACRAPGRRLSEDSPGVPDDAVFHDRRPRPE